jgi:hypothetical protein
VVPNQARAQDRGLDLERLVELDAEVVRLRRVQSRLSACDQPVELDQLSAGMSSTRSAMRRKSPSSR